MVTEPEVKLTWQLDMNYDGWQLAQIAPKVVTRGYEDLVAPTSTGVTVPGGTHAIRRSRARCWHGLVAQISLYGSDDRPRRLDHESREQPGRSTAAEILTKSAGPTRRSSRLRPPGPSRLKHAAGAS